MMGQGSSRTEPSSFDVFGLESGASHWTPGKRKRFAHPSAALFHVIFKFLSIILYLFGGIFGQEFLTTFVLIILLVSMDFWVVKNVTGRLLVGLRWSNYIDNEGNSHWIYENKNTIAGQNNRSSATNTNNSSSLSLNLQKELDSVNRSADASIFWSALILAPAFWFVLLIISLFKLNIQWFMLVALALVLSTSNLYGYVRCRLGTSDIRSMATQFVAKQLFYNFIGGSSAN